MTLNITHDFRQNKVTSFESQRQKERKRDRRAQMREAGRNHSLFLTPHKIDTQWFTLL